MFYASEVVYLFEGSEELIRIPRLPVKLDAKESVRKHLDKIRKLEILDVLPLSQCAQLSPIMLCKVGDEAKLSVWGKMLWDEYKKDLYQEEILPILTDKIDGTGAEFKKSLKGLVPQEVEQLNGQLDLLTRYVEIGRQEMPKSLSYKKLSRPLPSGSTHEFYAWSDGAAKRVFAHERDDIIYLDRLGNHL